MIFALDSITLSIAFALLLGLSIITVQYCRQQDRDQESRNEQQYLFSGQSLLHSYASNLGSIFSVTYFFGATIIYSKLYRSWLPILFVAIIVSATFILTKIIQKLHEDRTGDGDTAPQNPILLFLKNRLGKNDFRFITSLYVVIYIGLLVEEIGVSRLLLVTLFPGNPAATSLILSTILLCIAGYIYAGGFRALLNSDLVQLAIAAPFILTLIYLIWSSSSPGGDSASLGKILLFQTGLPSWLLGSNMVFAFIFGVSWFVSSVDYFSRLNFVSRTGETPLAKKIQLTRITFLSILLVLTVGAIFGANFDTGTVSFTSPVDYFSYAGEFFLLGNSPLVAIVVILTLYSMMFTTIDTLLFSLLQIGWYQDRRFLRRENLLQILVGCTLVSSVIDLNSLGSIGIFLGSLTILPASIILKTTTRLFKRLLPEGVTHLKWTLGISTLIFVFQFDRLKLPFEMHFLIPGIVAVTFVFASFATRLTAGRSSQ